MKKKKKDLFTEKKKVKRVKPTKVVRTTKRKRTVSSPFKITIRDWGTPYSKHEQLELNENSKLEIMIDGAMYVVSINKKNRCLQFDTHETHLYLQPTSVHSFLVKANSHSKK